MELNRQSLNHKAAKTAQDTRLMAPIKHPETGCLPYNLAQKGALYNVKSQTEREKWKEI